MYRPDRACFAGGKNAGQCRVTGEDILGRRPGSGGVRHAELARGDPNARKLFGDGIGKPLFAQYGGSAARLLHHHGHLSLCADERGQHARRRRACLVIVRGDEADVVLNLDSGVEDGDRDARPDRAFERSYQGAFVGRGDGQPVHLTGNHGIHDLDLPIVIGFVIGPIPQDAHVQIVRGLLDSGMYRDKKQMRGGLGNYTDELLMRTPAGS